MTLLSWLFPPKSPEKERIVELIGKETQRLNGAVFELTKEVRKVKDNKSEMERLFDDALQVMSKEYRK